MAFLFKSKKHNNALPPSSAREIHTPDSATRPAPNNNATGGRPRRPSQTPTPGSSVNNSLSSLRGPLSESPESKVKGNSSLERLIEEPVKVQQNGPMGPPTTKPPGGPPPTSPPPNNPNASLYPWSQRRFKFTSSQAPPFPRYGAAINSVSKEGDIYMMGGLVNGSVVKGDLWMVEAASGNLSCYPIPTFSDGPGPRVGHASLLVGNAFIVFGGDTKTEENDTLDDTLYLLNTSSRHWSRANPSGPKPAGRYGHTLNILGSKIYVFGGQVEGLFFNDLVAFDLNSLQTANSKWELLLKNTMEGGPPAGSVPQPRTNHSVITWNEKLFLFGGTNGEQWFNDVWTYDPQTNSWSALDCIGYIPAPREGHSAALVGDTMYIFGGRTDEGHDLGDLAAFRIPSRRWYTFQNMGPAPSPRSGHSMTAYNKHIIVMAGEPSSSTRDVGELSLVYILDTSKIRYPNDQHVQQTPAGERVPGNRRPSGNREMIRGGPTQHRESPNGPPDGMKGRHTPSRESIMGGPPGQSPRNVDPNTMNGGPVGNMGSRLPRASMAQSPPGPPPQQQAPVPQTNGNGPRSKTPTKNERMHGPPVDTGRAAAIQKESQREVRSPRENSPITNVDLASLHGTGRHTPSQQATRITSPAIAAKAMEAGEAAPLVRSESLRSRSRHGRQHSSMSSVNDSWAKGASESRQGNHSQGDGAADGPQSRSREDAPKSPRLSSQNLAIMKELESLRTKNEWLASELALARKSGYQPNFSNHSIIDEGATASLSDSDRPLIEALLAMKAELANMQSSVEEQAATAARKMGEVEQQRDAAVAEAVYARAKLAAQSGSSPSGTPQLEHPSREINELQADHTQEISRRLASSLAAQNELKNKLEVLAADLQSEKRARAMAEETAEAAAKHVSSLDQQQNSMELESLKAELHQVQKEAREAAAEHGEVETAMRMLEVEKEDLSRRLDEIQSNSQGHNSTLSSLQEALTASTDKASLLQQTLNEERSARESLEERLRELRAEYEESTAELESVTRKLSEAEKLAEANAREANTHREAVLAGLHKLTLGQQDSPTPSSADSRVAILQEQMEQANNLVRSNQAAADDASEKLRKAEERIAGLEAYQEQASREGLQIRRQLQSVTKESQALSAENAGIKRLLETQQRDASALAVQHGALKDLLGERGISVAEARMSRSLDSPGSRFGTPEQARLRELEQQLEQSLKAHEDTKCVFESREQEADRAYREKLEQLEQDYQSAVHYVKGTEKMLKRMKDELSKYKTQNSRLQSELEEAASGKSEGDSNREAPPSWEHEREELHKELEDIQEQLHTSVSQLESQLQSVNTELQSTKDDRDRCQMENENIRQELTKATEKSREELEQLKKENSLLEARALDAEQRVNSLLEQVEISVDNYRRQSQQLPPNGISGHQRNLSGTSTTEERPSTDNESRSNFGPDNRNSMALDSLASELDALRSHWENSHRNYRLSSQFDFEKTPTSPPPDFNDSLANWRRKLELEEAEAAHNEDGKGGSSEKNEGATNRVVSPISTRQEGQPMNVM
ncbi:MAG: Negative regulator of mitotic exit [Cirrosporium novae-zelandiae]|nr:MAG: Negative regulator of mitotic exit [Cirrosporium novae-zelandiae]